MIMDYLSGKKTYIKSVVDNETGKYLSSKFTFNTLCDYIFIKLSSDEKVEICDKFLSDEIKKILRDKELIESVNSFITNNLNISETSRNAFLHRNTLLYRIEKIYRKTGLNVRKFDDAVTFKILSIINAKKNYNG